MLCLFTVIIYYFYNLYSFYLYPDVLAIFVSRNRVFVRLKYQPIGLVEVTRPLSFSAFSQLMVVARQVAYIL